MKLEKNNVERIIGLTPTQEGILFHYLYTDDPHTYFEQTCLYLSGPLNAGACTKSWQYVVQQNQALRTSFAWQKIKKPVQIIHRQRDFAPEYFDLSAGDPRQREQQIRALREQDKQAGFDLEQVPFRVKVATLGEGNSLLLVSAHSILYDGWSFQVVLKEFFAAYHSICGGALPEPSPKAQFADYVQLLPGGPVAGEEAYWTHYLADFPRTQTPFKEGKPTPAARGMSTHVLTVAPGEAAGIDAFCRRYALGVPAFFYAAWGVLLQKLTAADDAVFGTTFSGRSVHLKGIESIVGNFLKTLPVRIRTAPGDTVRAVVGKVAADLQDMQQFELTPLTRIREYARTEGQGELFDALVIFENYPVHADAQPGNSGLRVYDYAFEHASSYDLTVFIVKQAGSYELHFAAGEGKFRPAALARIAGYLHNLIGSFLAGADTPVRALSVLSAAEREKVLYGFNDTAVAYPRDITLKELLEAPADRYAHRVAVVCNDQQVTYRELHERANRLARHLRGSFGEAGTRLGLMVDRSVEMVVAVLAVIKAGYAYVPLDPYLPERRVRKMVRNLALPGVLTTDNFAPQAERLLGDGAGVSVLYRLGPSCQVKHSGDPLRWTDVRGGDPGSLPRTANPGDEAYVIFTSGSTGVPKGVVVQHRPVVNILEWVNNTFAVDCTDKVFCVASLGFDLSVYDIFGTLSRGGAIHVGTYHDLQSPAAMLARMARERVSVWNSAPAVLQNLVQWCELNQPAAASPALRLVLLSGDWIGLQLPDRVKKYFSRARVVSLGGATEATVWSNYYFIDRVDPAWTSIPYGRPLQNCRYYVLDPDLNPCPVDVAGDLYIGGQCLALGYVNDPALTHRKFKANPFVAGERMYATGDVARWHEDGNLELIGRKDNQVKIRGYRIELGEIESALLEIPGITGALALVNARDNGDKYICAYYLGGQELDAAYLREQLAARLPAYMIPLWTMRLGELPVSANGKVDRHKLPMPATGEEAAAAAPLNGLQAFLAGTWSAILQVPAGRIGPDSNFFELGGHSLNVTELASRIARKYDIQIGLREVFAAATLGELAHLVARGLLEARREIKPAEKKEYYPLTPAQLRMYALQETNKGGTTYNITGGMILGGALDVAGIRQALARVVARHESFRTSYRLVDGQVVQVVEEACTFAVEYLETEPENLHRTIGAFVRPFDLEKAPLIRAAVIRTAPLEHCLVLDMHHIAADGYTLKKLIADFVAAFAGRAVPPPARQYRDYAEWVNKPGYQALLAPGKQYWLRQFPTGKTTRLNLPLDYQRPAVPDYNGDKVFFDIDGEHFRGLRRLAADARTTLFTAVLSVFNVMLARVCRQDEVIVGTPVIGRHHHELDGTAGMFVNTLVLKNAPEAGKTFSAFLEEVKQKVSGAFAHADVPFDYLARALSEENHPGVHPVFDVFFEYDNLGLHDVKLEGLDVQVMTDLVRRAKFDLSLEVVEWSDRMACRFEYRTTLFRAETIGWLVENFQLVLARVLENKAVTLGEIDVFGLQPAPPGEAEIAFNF